MTAVITTTQPTAKVAITIDSQIELTEYLLGLQDLGIETRVAGTNATGYGFLVWLQQDGRNEARLRGIVGQLELPVTVLVDEMCHGNQTCLAPHHAPTCESLDVPPCSPAPAADAFTKLDPSNYADL
jgi:hypothetical protein